MLRWLFVISVKEAEKVHKVQRQVPHKFFSTCAILLIQNAKKAEAEGKGRKHKKKVAKSEKSQCAGKRKEWMRECLQKKSLSPQKKMNRV